MFRNGKRTSSSLEEGKPAFYFPHFSLEAQPPWFQYETYRKVSVEDFIEALAAVEEPVAAWTLGHQADFQSFFQTIKERIFAGNLKKAVPYTFAYAPETMTNNRLQRSLKSALGYLQQFPGTVYGRWECQKGFLGVTPDLSLPLSRGELYRRSGGVGRYPPARGRGHEH